jgi:hypothetical protein
VASVGPEVEVATAHALRSATKDSGEISDERRLPGSWRRSMRSSPVGIREREGERLKKRGRFCQEREQTTRRLALAYGRYVKGNGVVFVENGGPENPMAMNPVLLRPKTSVLSERVFVCDVISSFFRQQQLVIREMSVCVVLCVRV